MHSSCTDRPTYTGARMFPSASPMMGHRVHPEPQGFCHSCCHPRNHCLCARRECRKEAKELMVNSDTAARDKSKQFVFLNVKASSLPISGNEAVNAVEDIVNGGTVFIGGGCCVHLSVEYMANNPAIASAVEILVVDSAGTVLGWGRIEPAGTPYRIKEGIITTKPGAKLAVIAKNATVRVRWCEIFSC